MWPVTGDSSRNKTINLCLHFSGWPPAGQYGGWNIGSHGEKIRATAGALNAVLPASGVLVFRRL
ncbi:hypothetical protein AOG23_27850 [Rhizobium acidisoli]|nr:hypothetical protein AOG23_27850 [Rhizobium acidisoli]